MKRRDVLTTTALFVSAGCLGGGGDGDNGSGGTETTADATTLGIETPAGGTGEPTETDAGTSTPGTDTEPTTATEPAGTATDSGDSATGTATRTPNTAIPAPARLTVRQADAPPSNEASVAFENGGSRVIVTGTITGQNGCQTAVLDSVRKTKSGLVITVATERDAPANASCSMALVGIEYRFATRVETPPASVTVIHHGATGNRTITTAKPGG
jgi:hypothetical protein